MKYLITLTLLIFSLACFSQIKEFETYQTLKFGKNTNNDQKSIVFTATTPITNAEISFLADTLFMNKNVTIGASAVGDVFMKFNQGEGNNKPYLGYNQTLGKLVGSHDGTTKFELGSGGSGVGDSSIFQLYDAEDEDLTSWSTASMTNATLSINGTTPLKGSFDYKITNVTSSASEYACTPVITLDEYAKNKFIGLRMATSYDGDSGDMKVWLEDVTNSVSISSEMIDAGNKSVMVAGFNQSTTSTIKACFQVYAENNGKNLFIDNLEFVVNPLRDIKLKAVQHIDYDQLGSDLVSNDTTIRLNLSNITESGENAGIAISDDGTYTRFTATKDNVHLFGTWGCDTGAANEIVQTRVNGTIKTYGSDTVSADDYTHTSFGVWLNSGDYLTLSKSSGICRTTNKVWFSATAESFSDATVLSDNSGEQLYQITQAVASMPDTTGEYRFNLSTASIDNFTDYGEYIQAIDDTVYADNRTRFEATQDAIITVDWSATGDNNAEYPFVYKNDSFYQRGGTPGANGQEFGMSASVRLKAGEYITIGYSGNTSGTVVLKLRARKDRTATNIITPSTQTCYLKDIKSSTAGGTFTTGAWRTRDLTNVEGDTNIVTLDSNQFTLSSGKYLIEASAPAYRVDRHQAIIYNVTDSSDELQGTAAYSDSGAAGEGDVTTSVIIGTINISSSKTFELRHYGATTKASDGFGISVMAGGFGAEDVYSVVKITKVK